MWAKTNCFLIGHGDENKKGKGTNKCAIKQKLKFENYKDCLEAIQLENEINYLRKNKPHMDSLRENHKELLKS